MGEVIRASSRRDSTAMMMEGTAVVVVVMEVMLGLMVLGLRDRCGSRIAGRVET